MPDTVVVAPVNAREFADMLARGRRKTGASGVGVMLVSQAGHAVSILADDAPAEEVIQEAMDLLEAFHQSFGGLPQISLVLLTDAPAPESISSGVDAVMWLHDHTVRVIPMRVVPMPALTREVM